MIPPVNSTCCNASDFSMAGQPGATQWPFGGAAASGWPLGAGAAYQPSPYDIFDPSDLIGSPNNMNNMLMPPMTNDQGQNMLAVISLLQMLIQLLMGNAGGGQDPSLGDYGSNSVGGGGGGGGGRGGVRGGGGGSGGSDNWSQSGSAGGSHSASSTGSAAPVGPTVGRLEGGDITGKVYEVLKKQSTKTNITQTADGIQITHPKGSWLGKDGLKPQIPIEGARKATLEYDVTFKEGFDFHNGGKMPGLGGGEANRGGTTPDGNGFSARFMFRKGGKLVAYVYDMDKKKAYGKDIDTGIVMKPGEKYTIRQHIELNSGSNNDGKLQVWVNGKLAIDRQDMRFVNGNDPKNKIDQLMFHSYYGGSTGGAGAWQARNESTFTTGNIKYQPG